MTQHYDSHKQVQAGRKDLTKHGLTPYSLPPDSDRTKSLLYRTPAPTVNKPGASALPIS